jgi:hypothetical protein
MNLSFGSLKKDGASLEQGLELASNLLEMGALQTLLV